MKEALLFCVFSGLLGFAAISNSASQAIVKDIRPHDIPKLAIGVSYRFPNRKDPFFERFWNVALTSLRNFKPKTLDIIDFEEGSRPRFLPDGVLPVVLSLNSDEPERLNDIIEYRTQGSGISSTFVLKGKPPVINLDWYSLVKLVPSPRLNESAINAEMIFALAYEIFGNAVFIRNHPDFLNHHMELEAMELRQRIAGLQAGVAMLNRMLVSTRDVEKNDHLVAARKQAVQQILGLRQAELSQTIIEFNAKYGDSIVRELRPNRPVSCHRPHT